MLDNLPRLMSSRGRQLHLGQMWRAQTLMLSSSCGSS